jgi:cytochrome c556
MRRMKSRLGELMHLGDLRRSEKDPMRIAEQSYLDLKACSDAMPALHKQYDDRAKADEWLKISKAGEAALAELLKATRGEDLRRKLEALGKSCDDCHKLVEEDFRYVDMFK